MATGKESSVNSIRKGMKILDWEWGGGRRVKSSSLAL